MRPIPPQVWNYLGPDPHYNMTSLTWPHEVQPAQPCFLIYLHIVHSQHLTDFFVYLGVRFFTQIWLSATYAPQCSFNTVLTPAWS